MALMVARPSRAGVGVFQRMQVRSFRRMDFIQTVGLLCVLTSNLVLSQLDHREQVSAALTLRF